MKTCLERVPKQGGHTLDPPGCWPDGCCRFSEKAGERLVLEMWSLKMELVVERSRDPAFWGILMAAREPVVHTNKQLSSISCMKESRLAPWCSTQAHVDPLLSEEKCNLEAQVFQHVVPMVVSFREPMEALGGRA